MNLETVWLILVIFFMIFIAYQQKQADKITERLGHALMTANIALEMSYPNLNYEALVDAENKDIIREGKGFKVILKSKGEIIMDALKSGKLLPGKIA